MGPAGYSVLGALGQTRGERSTWESDTSVRCQASFVAKRSLSIFLTLGERIMSTTRLASVDTVLVSVFLRRNSGATGSTSLSMHGSYMGLAESTVSLRMGVTSCERTRWVSDTSVVCQSGHGGVGSRWMAVTTGARAGSGTKSFSASAGTVSVARRGNTAASGAVSVTLHGASLALASGTAALRSGQTGGERTTWMSDTCVRSQLGRGVWGSRGVLLTVGSRAGSMTVGMSADAESVSVMHRGNGAVTGSVLVSMHGVSMGSSAYTSSGRVGPTLCERTAWAADTTVWC